MMVRSWRSPSRTAEDRNAQDVSTLTGAHYWRLPSGTTEDHNRLSDGRPMTIQPLAVALWGD